MAAAGIKVKGAAELDRAFRQLRREVLVELKPALAEIAEVVRVDAERLGPERIRNLGARWSRMRVGVIASGVYVAPKSRRRGGSPRGNLGPLLLSAMEEALDKNKEAVTAKFDALIDVSAARAGFF